MRRPGAPDSMGRAAAVAGVAIVAALVAVAVVGPALAGDPTRGDIEHGLSPVGAPLPPSAAAWLGTDELGRDVWARVVAGAGASLWIAGAATLVATALGAALGIAAGTAGPRLDAALMRAVDLVLALPTLVLAIFLAALLHATALADSGAPVVLAIAATSWTGIARVVATEARAIARSEAVLAARALGATPLRIARRHVLPGVAGLVGALAAGTFAQALLAEAALSYLGLGAPPPAASWGRMIYDGRAYYRTAPWLVAAPGVAIVLAVLGVHLCAEAARRRAEAR